jgi:hypothetical protein
MRHLACQPGTIEASMYLLGHVGIRTAAPPIGSPLLLPAKKLPEVRCLSGFYHREAHVSKPRLSLAALIGGRAR